ncbi:hypothetical protein KPB2_5569 [Klebsiella pneumoniae Kb677]|nr:hypothetical protein KPB2_5569 [Klebsiella pneumoniae Kb677]
MVQAVRPRDRRKPRLKLYLLLHWMGWGCRRASA